MEGDQEQGMGFLIKTWASKDGGATTVRTIGQYSLCASRPACDPLTSAHNTGHVFAVTGKPTLNIKQLIATKINVCVYICGYYVYLLCKCTHIHVYILKIFAWMCVH